MVLQGTAPLKRSLNSIIHHCVSLLKVCRQVAPGGAVHIHNDYRQHHHTNQYTFLLYKKGEEHDKVLISRFFTPLLPNHSFTKTYSLQGHHCELGQLLKSGSPPKPSAAKAISISGRFGPIQGRFLTPQPDRAFTMQYNQHMITT